VNAPLSARLVLSFDLENAGSHDAPTIRIVAPAKNVTSQQAFAPTKSWRAVQTNNVMKSLANNASTLEAGNSAAIQTKETSSISWIPSHALAMLNVTKDGPVSAIAVLRPRHVKVAAQKMKFATSTRTLVTASCVKNSAHRDKSKLLKNPIRWPDLAAACFLARA